MKLNNKTILITGGSAGLGLAMAQQLIAMDNTVIICGRNTNRLEQAKNNTPKLHTIITDVSNESSIDSLFTEICQDFPKLDILINNAGVMHIHDVANNSLSLAHQQQEIQTNFFGVVALCHTFIPLLKRQDNAAIINVTSGLAYMPFMAAPVYTATKAAIHSYSLSIRQSLEGSSVSVIEALPPMIDTDMTDGLEMDGIAKMSPKKLATVIIKKVAAGKQEIRPGASAMMIAMYKIFPWLINSIMKKMAPKMLRNIPDY